MYLISKLLIKMKFDSQHTRKIASQFLGLAYRPEFNQKVNDILHRFYAVTCFYFASLT